MPSDDGKQNKIIVFDRVPTANDLKEDEPAHAQLRDGSFFYCLKHKGQVNIVKMETVKTINVNNYYDAVNNSFSANSDNLSGLWTPIGSHSLTYSHGWWLKSGTSVIAMFTVSLAATGDGASFTLTGLPFRILTTPAWPAENAGAQGTGTIHYHDTAPNPIVFSCFPNGTNNGITFLQHSCAPVVAAAISGDTISGAVFYVVR